MDQKTQHPAGQGGEAPAIGCAACACCGITAAETPPPMTWTCSVEAGERQYFCENCARANIRAIEGRLDSTWW